MEVYEWCRHVKIEPNTFREWLAPQNLVVTPERCAVLVGVFAAGI